MAHQSYWHWQTASSCEDSFILGCFSRMCHIDCYLSVLYGVLVYRVYIMLVYGVVWSIVADTPA